MNIFIIVIMMLTQDLHSARTYIEKLAEQLGRHERAARLAQADADQFKMQNEGLVREVSLAVMMEAKAVKERSQAVASTQKMRVVMQEHLKEHVAALTSRLDTCSSHVEATLVTVRVDTYV